MTRAFEGGKLVVASHNPGKVREIGDLLAPFGIETVSAGDLGLDEPEETGETFRANAELKALAAAKAANLPALADDSGLCVNALSGAPGIYSARWAGPNKDFAFAMEKLRRGMLEAGLSDTSAFFICGLPGGIDYGMLAAVKEGLLSSEREKFLNTKLNVWMRAPGLTMVAYAIYP